MLFQFWKVPTLIHTAIRLPGKKLLWKKVFDQWPLLLFSGEIQESAWNANQRRRSTRTCQLFWPQFLGEQLQWKPDDWKVLWVSFNSPHGAGQASAGEQISAARRKMLGLPDKKALLFKGTQVFWESKAVSDPLGSEEGLLYPAGLWVTFNDKIHAFTSPAVRSWIKEASENYLSLFWVHEKWPRKSLWQRNQHNEVTRKSYWIYYSPIFSIDRLNPNLLYWNRLVAEKWVLYYNSGTRWDSASYWNWNWRSLRERNVRGDGWLFSHLLKWANLLYCHGNSLFWPQPWVQ